MITLFLLALLAFFGSPRPKAQETSQEANSQQAAIDGQISIFRMADYRKELALAKFIQTQSKNEQLLQYAESLLKQDQISVDKLAGKNSATGGANPSLRGHAETSQELGRGWNAIHQDLFQSELRAAITRLESLPDLERDRAYLEMQIETLTVRKRSLDVLGKHASPPLRSLLEEQFENDAARLKQAAFLLSSLKVAP